MLTALTDIHAAEKRIPTLPKWQQRSIDWFYLVSPLDIAGVTIEGLRLRVTAMVRRPNECVTFQLEYTPPRGDPKGGAFDRLEWRPVSAHTNKGVGPPGLRHVVQSSSHHHSFEANWNDGQSARVKRGELPIAVPISPDPASFEEALALAGERFKINNIGVVDRPPWKVLLI